MRRRRYTRAPPCTCACVEYKRIHFRCFRMEREKRNCYHWHGMLLQSKIIYLICRNEQNRQQQHTTTTTTLEIYHFQMERNAERKEFLECAHLSISFHRFWFDFGCFYTRRASINFQHFNKSNRINYKKFQHKRQQLTAEEKGERKRIPLTSDRRQKWGNPCGSPYGTSHTFVSVHTLHTHTFDADKVSRARASGVFEKFINLKLNIENKLKFEMHKPQSLFRWRWRRPKTMIYTQRAPHQRRRKLLIGISKIVESLPRKLSFAQAATATATAATRGLFPRLIFCRQTRDREMRKITFGQLLKTHRSFGIWSMFGWLTLTDLLDFIHFR